MATHLNNTKSIPIPSSAEAPHLESVNKSAIASKDSPLVSGKYRNKKKKKKTQTVAYIKKEPVKPKAMMIVRNVMDTRKFPIQFTEVAMLIPTCVCACVRV